MSWYFIVNRSSQLLVRKSVLEIYIFWCPVMFDSQMSYQLYDRVMCYWWGRIFLMITFLSSTIYKAVLCFCTTPFSFLFFFNTTFHCIRFPSREHLTPSHQSNNSKVLTFPHTLRSFKRLFLPLPRPSWQMSHLHWTPAGGHWSWTTAVLFLSATNISVVFHVSFPESLVLVDAAQLKRGYFDLWISAFLNRHLQSCPIVSALSLYASSWCFNTISPSVLLNTRLPTYFDKANTFSS